MTSLLHKQPPSCLFPLRSNKLDSAINIGLFAAFSAFALFSVVRAPPRTRMALAVKWGRDRFRVPLPPPDSKLADLRATLADITSLPPNSFKIIHAGAVMKDDSAPISVYGISPKSTLAIIGGDTSQAPAPLARPTEQAMIAQIHTELASVRNALVPSLHSFLDSLHSFLDSLEGPPLPSLPPTPTEHADATPQISTKADLEHEHTRLGELFLQSLLRLDLINLEGEWSEARKERKLAVKEVQGLLEKLDGGWKARREWVS